METPCQGHNHAPEPWIESATLARWEKEESRGRRIFVTGALESPGHRSWPSPSRPKNILRPTFEGTGLRTLRGGCVVRRSGKRCETWDLACVGHVVQVTRTVEKSQAPAAGDRLQPRSSSKVPDGRTASLACPWVVAAGCCGRWRRWRGWEGQEPQTAWPPNQLLYAATSAKPRPLQESTLLAETSMR